MQKLMCLVRKRLFQELLIKLLDIKVLMGTAVPETRILVVKSFGALFTDLVVDHIRLTAAADTAAGTCHDLDEMVRQRLVIAHRIPHLLHDLADIPQAMRHRDYRKTDNSQPSR